MQRALLQRLPNDEQLEFAIAPVPDDFRELGRSAIQRTQFPHGCLAFDEVGWAMIIWIDKPSEIARSSEFAKS